jgi:hypothetical protein
MSTDTYLLRRIRETAQAIGVSDGTVDDITDPTTGEITSRERVVWLPKSQVTITATRAERGAVYVELQVPDWLATKSGLTGDRCRKTGDLFR